MSGKRPTSPRHKVTSVLDALFALAVLIAVWVLAAITLVRATQIAIAAALIYFWPMNAWPGPVDAYRAQITREAQFRFGIPSPAPAIAAQMQQESGGNPTAQSPVGATGLMQFMPKTAEWAATAGSLGQAQPTNPAWAIRAGVWYDRWLFDRVKADSECDKWLFALSSYNGGLGYVYKRQKLSPQPGSWRATGTINPGIHPANQRENETYGPKILAKHQPQFAHWGRTVCL